MKKKGIILEIILFVLVLFVGCGAKGKIAKEKQCVTDFVEFEREQMEVISTLNFSEIEEREIDDFITIEKRQTDVEHKSDTVYCMITAMNDYATHEYECVLYYNLYNNNEWILDDVCIEKENILIHTPPTDEEIFQKMNEEHYVEGAWETLKRLEIVGQELYEYEQEGKIENRYSVSVKFCAERNPAPIGFSAEGTFYCDILYNSGNGKWEWENWYYNLEHQNILELDASYWQKVPDISNGFLSPSYLHFVNIHETFYQIGAPDFDEHYNETEEILYATIDEGDVLQGSIMMERGGKEYATLYFDWLDSKISVRKSENEIDYYEKTDTPVVGKVR